MHDIGMKLPQRHDVKFIDADRAKESFADLFDGLARIPVAEAEVQSTLVLLAQTAVAIRVRRSEITRSSGTRAESVHEPTEPREHRRFEHLESAGTAERPRRPVCRVGALSWGSLLHEGRGIALFGLWTASAVRFDYIIPRIRTRTRRAGG